MGIVYIDEVDKLRGLGVQHALLKLLEGTVPPQGSTVRHRLRHDECPVHLRRGVRRAGRHHLPGGSGGVGSDFSWLKIARWLVMGYCCGRSSPRIRRRLG
jgi:hypothetical protein